MTDRPKLTWVHWAQAWQSNRAPLEPISREHCWVQTDEERAKKYVLLRYWTA